MKTLNIIGAGRAGRTLAALWRERSVFSIQDIVNRSASSAQAAAAFIGAGRVRESVQAMRSADLWLIATPDGEMLHAAQSLASSGLLRSADVVFQLSGATPSTELTKVLGGTVGVGSAHPLKSFADANDARRTFKGTYCAMEGSAAALAALRPAFEQIGAQVTEIDPQFKTVYHAASVMVCNYLTALMEAGLQCYEKAGLPRATASAMMEPLVRETVDNVFRLGTVKALTGPIARGDHAVVQRQMAAMGDCGLSVASVYQSLGAIAVNLSREKGEASAEALAAIAHALSRSPVRPSQ